MGRALDDPSVSPELRAYLDDKLGAVADFLRNQ
jgi:hypothetical protein